MTQESRLSIVIDSKNAKVNAEEVAKTIRDLESAGFAATKSNAQLSGSMNRMASEADAAASSIKRGLIAALGGLSAMSVIDVADEWGQYASRIRMATKSAEEYEYVQKRMVKSAQATFRAINETRESFIQMSPVLRDMGLSLSQSIDAVDTFSGLLVVNGANAQRGAAAMEALAKSLQRGRIDAQAWMTIYSTVDNVVDLLAASTGKSAEEIRRLGIEGKISAEMIATALVQGNSQVLKSVEGMPTTVRDAMLNINTAFGEYIGRTNEANQVTATLAEGLGVVGKNVESILTVAIVGATAGLARYSAGLVVATTQTVYKAVESRRAAVEELRLAEAQVVTTTAALAQARALGTLTVNMAQQTAAATALEAAEKRLATAKAASAAAGRATLGVLGGPMGIAVTAGLAATAFLTLRNNTDESKRSFDELSGSLDEVIKRFREMAAYQREEALVLAEREQETKARELEQAYSDLISKLHEVNGLRSNWSAEDWIEFRQRVVEAKEAGEDLLPLLIEMRESSGINPRYSSEMMLLNSSLMTAKNSFEEAAGKASALRSEMEALADSANDAAGSVAGLNDQLDQTRGEWLTKYATQAEKLTAELDKAREAFGGVIPPDIEKRIREAFSSKARSGISSAASEAKKLADEIDRLVGSLYPAIEAEKEWVKSQKLLDQALKQGKITQEQHTKGLVKLQEAYELVAFAATDHVKALQDEVKSLKASIPSLRDRVRHFGLSASVIARHAEVETRSSLATAQATLAIEKAKGASEERVKQVEQEIKALEELAKYQAEATGYISEYESLERERRYFQEVSDEAKRTHEEIERSLTDALLRGFESGKGFGKNFIDTLKNMFGSLVLRPIIQPIAAGAAGMVTGALGLGSTGQSAGLLGLLGGASNISQVGSVLSGGFVSGLASSVGSIGSALGSSALTSFAAGMKGSTLAAGLAGPTTAGATGAMGMGAQFAAVAPWLAGGAAVLGIGSMIHKMTQGETRSGGGFVYDPNSRQAMYHSGPSGGYGGQQTLSAVESLFSSAADTIVHVFEGAGVDAGLAFFHGAFESSSKGRGGTFSGGDIVLADGSVIGFGGAKKGDGFGGKSGSTEEMFANLQAEMHFSVLEAWKTVGSQMPQVIRDMLNGIDIRSLSAEQAQAAVVDISALTSQVTTLTAALNTLPIESLKNLSFDLAYGLSQASGGMEALAANSASFYQGFYSEAERQEHLHRQLVDTLGAVNVQLPSSREGFRHLVDSLGEVTEANQHTIAALLGAASAADQYYAELERRQNEAHQERQRLEQEAYNSARSHVDSLMSAFKELAQKQIRELEQVSKSTDKIANALQKSLNTQISSLTSVSSMLTDMVNELRGGAKLFEMQSAEGWRLIGNTISTGIIPDADKLRSAVGSIRADLDDRYYGSIFERQRDQLVLANQLDSINALAKPQLTIAEQQLQVMQDQLAELREGTKRAFELAGLSQAQIAAIKAVDDKTAANVGLTKDQLEALRTGNNASTVLQNLTREQIQGILGVKSEVSGVYGLSAQQLAELSRNTGVANVIKSLTDAQIAALKAVDDKTAKALGLSESQISALQSGNAQALALQGLTREQLQGILGVKSETSSLHGLSQSQIEAMKSVDLSTQSVAELIDHLQKATEAERLASKQIDAIQSQLGTMQAQYEQLRGLNLSMTSLDEGMRLLAVAMKAEQAAKPPASGQSTSFGGRDFQFSSQSAAKNYLLGNTGLLGAFAEEVAKGWASPTDYLKYAQLHYSDYGWAENRNQSVGKNQGRTHKPGGYSEAQAYLAANQDVMTAYLREVKSGGAAGGDRGMLAFVQSHFDQYGRHEMPLRKYARGGDHFGGLRLVGELGPELEVTGPSRIFNANKTQDILRNMSAGPDISGLMQGLIRENQQLRQMYENMMRSMIAMQQRMARVLERWEGDDYPVRVEEMPDKPIVVTVKKEVA